MNTHPARPTNSARRMRVAPSLLLVAVALSLAACEKPAPPVVEPPPPPPPPAPVVHKPVVASWNFQTGDVCTATAGGGPLSLEIAVSRDTVALTVHLAKHTSLPVGRAAAIAFSGAGG